MGAQNVNSLNRTYFNVFLKTIQIECQRHWHVQKGNVNSRCIKSVFGISDRFAWQTDFESFNLIWHFVKLSQRKSIVAALDYSHSSPNLRSD